MEEKYLIFNVNNIKYSIRLLKSIYVETTYINKVSKNKITKKYVLNYKSENFEVLDLNFISNGKMIRKYDGLILVKKKGIRLAFKFEGLFEYKNENSNTVELKLEDYLQN